MPPPEKKPRADAECEWDDFDDVPFEVVEQAEVIASQIFGKRTGGDGSAVATTSIAACGRSASTPKIAIAPAKLGSASGTTSGPSSRMMTTSAASCGVLGGGIASAVEAPLSSSGVSPRAAAFRRINSSPEIPIVASAPAAAAAAGAAVAAPRAASSTRDHLEKIPAPQLEVERLGQCLLMRDGEIKMLRSSLKQKASELTRLKQDRLVDLQSQSSAESEKERELRRQVESLRTQLQFQDREMAELRFHLSSASRRQQTQSAGSGAVSPVRTGLSMSPSTSAHALGFPSSKSFYGTVRKVTFDDAHKSPEKVPSAIKPLTESGEPSARAQPDKRRNKLVDDLLACGFCDLMLTDVHHAALEVIDKRRTVETAHRARRSMQRLLASVQVAAAHAAASDSAIDSQNAVCDFINFLSAAELYVGSYAGSLRGQQQLHQKKQQQQQLEEQRALGQTMARPTQAEGQLPLRKALGGPASSEAALCASLARVDSGSAMLAPAVVAAAAERAERCLLGLSHLADRSVDVCEVLLGGAIGGSAAIAAGMDSRSTACGTLPPPALGNNGTAPQVQPSMCQLLVHVITCADLRVGQEDCHRLRVCEAALQLLLTLCCSSEGDLAAVHVAREACSRFTSLVQDGTIAAALHSQNASVVQSALALLTPIIMRDGGTQASLICCPSIRWCAFELVNSLLSSKYHTHTTEVHLQVLHFLSCLCMIRSCHELLTAEPMICPSHKQIVSSVVTLIYPHVLAYEEAHCWAGHGCSTQSDALVDTCVKVEHNSSSSSSSSDFSGVPSIWLPQLDRLVLQQGLHVLHILSQIDRRFSSRHAAVEHEYVYVMNFASDLFKEQRKALGAASQLSSTMCTDEESLIDSLWDFEYDEDSDDKEAMAIG